MTEHTLGPWETGEFASRHIVFDANGNEVAKCTGPSLDANSSFIVTACNSHNGLLEICQRILRFDEKGFIKLKPSLHNDLQREIRKAEETQ